MTKSKKVIFFLSFVFMHFVPQIACGQEIELVTEDFPSEAEKISENKIGGIGGEIFTQAMEEKKIPYKIIWETWKRAQVIVLLNAEKKSFIIPLTRTKERENNYIWVSKIYDAETVFFTTKNSKKINTFKDANGKTINVLSGSSFEQKLRSVRNEIPKSQIYLCPLESLCFSNLSTQKIDSVYTNLIGGFAVLRYLKLNEKNFEVGEKIDVEENYIATAKSTPKKLVTLVANAIDDFKKTPKYSSIIKKYTGKL